MIRESQIRKLAEAHLAGTDRFIVDVIVKPGNRILVFIDSDTSVLIDHCASLSRYIESHLDRDTEDFELNVSSSGIDHPYTLVRQYIKNTGREVIVTLPDEQKITGTLVAADQKGFDILEKKKEKKIITEIAHHFAYSEIKETKEVIKF